MMIRRDAAGKARLGALDTNNDHPQDPTTRISDRLKVLFGVTG